MTVDVIHRECRQPAVRMRRQLGPGEVIQAKDFEHLDGSPIANYSRMRCDSCGQDLTGMGPGADGTPEVVSVIGVTA